jgi:hypothetical protein
MKRILFCVVLLALILTGKWVAEARQQATVKVPSYQYCALEAQVSTDAKKWKTVWLPCPENWRTLIN